MTGQAVTIANSFKVSGPAGELRMAEEGGTGKDLSWYNLLTGGAGTEAVRLFYYTTPGSGFDILAIGPGAAADTVTATRIKAVVGANAQQLANMVPVQGAAGLTASGTGPVVGGTLTFPVGQIPASTTLAWFDVNWTSAAAGDRITFYDATASFGAGALVTQVAGQEIDGSITVAQTFTGSRVVRYTITSAGAWSFGIVPHAYTQPT